MATANAELADRTLSHSVTLARLSAHEEQEVLRQLRKLENDLITLLERAHVTAFRKDRYQRLLTQAQQIIRTHYRTIRDTQQAKMEEVAALEGSWTVRALNGAISEPVGIYLNLASVQWTSQQVKAIAGNAVIDGSPSAAWWSRQAKDLQQRFATEVKQGLLRGTPTAEIARTIRGSAALNYSDGLLSLSRAQAEALVRSSISAVSTAARMETIQANGDLVKGYRQLSVMDSRTTIICLAYSGKRWLLDGTPIGHQLPMLPFPRHWNERSQLLPELKAFGEIAGRTLPQADDKTVDQLFREKLRGMGWSEERIASARRRTQASMDGQISIDEPFERFLERKGVDFQNKQLGKGKAELFRRGLVRDLSTLLDFRGNPLTLKQLRAQFGGQP